MAIFFGASTRNRLNGSLVENAVNGTGLKPRRE
jgi:hypothetical protein